MECAFLQGDLDEQHVDDNHDEKILKIESAQPVSDTFHEPVAELSRKLQLKNHQCVRSLKAVYGLVNDPRRWHHRLATDLGNMGSEESLLAPCVWTFRDGNGVLQVLCLVNFDDFMLACSDSTFGKQVFDGVDNLYGWGTWDWI